MKNVAKKKLQYIPTPEEEALKDVPLNKRELRDSAVEGLIILGYTFKEAFMTVEAHFENYYQKRNARFFNS